ncbi:MAG TPA: papain-like cysteine protease family protein [Allosphingosinicella sp.]
MPYNLMNYGFNGCPASFGAVQQNTTAAQMGNLADAANAGGFAFNSYLSNGAVMIGLYPPGCQSSPNLSWPLYLKANSLPQFMQQQTQGNWCWAANGASVGNLYWGSGTYTQCGIANTCQGKTTCCADPSGCNQYGYLDQALSAANSFDSMVQGTTGFAVLQGRVDNGQPVGTRVAWNGGGAHFTMVAGYDNNGNTIVIQDPWYGTSTIAYSAYPSNYQGGGTWTHTYYTKKQ